MLRALELAKNGIGMVSPNPMVGCIIVKQGKIIGEGWHRYFGGPHAEVNAIESVSKKQDISGSDVYVNLEPCSHFGKTPPCADLLAYYNVKNVFIANRDLNPLVQGKGIEKLKSEGVRVTEGILEKEGRILNTRFFTFHEKSRPYVILKWAVTADGYIARENFDSKWISNEYSRLVVHQWRSQEDGIMVGANTVLYDNPQLNVRDLNGKNPIRIIIDPNLKINGSFNIFDQKQKTLVYNYKKSSSEKNLIYIKVAKERYMLNVLHDLKRRDIQSVLVEGGKILLENIVQSELWDEARVFSSSKTFGSGLAAPHLINGKMVSKGSIFDDELKIFIRNNLG